ncbi:MAG TPA: xanthine dehydrogenase family protein molybdopterin-binding subunit [Steroidobacteraceae bacterium]|jgi:xanthine dehydrogenase YagR molybdenum-binding subunit|nr:xanthine dehydrogenase family protein molybdopterin-binding subunit [Steroidobacteraceae bacterium]
MADDKVAAATAGQLADEAAGAAAQVIGRPTPRIDGRAKVTGAARYGSDFAPEALVWACLRTSAIARGCISTIDERAARAVPGVLEILTFRNVGAEVYAGELQEEGGYMGSTMAPLQDEHVRHDGQIIAVVLADSFEVAREAAHRLNVRYAEEAPSAGFGAVGLTTAAARGMQAQSEDPHVGEFERAFAAADVRIDTQYATPAQHHNPLELFTTVAAWDGPKLTIWEASQNVWGFKHGLARQLRMPAEDIRVISPFIGGAFGSRGSLTQRTALIALAARRLGRPVKLVATRDQGFTIATYRAETRHHVRLGATRAGQLCALSHEGWEITSRPDAYSVAGTDASTRLYACPNVASRVHIVHADRNTPGYMRSPPETPYLFALESAMDELAYALDMDPVQLRLLNDTQREPIKGLPYTSRHLRECFEAAGQAFGWPRRSPAPRSMRDGDWLVGWGTATTMYPTQIAPAVVRVRLTAQGRVRVQSATHEIGTGVCTAIAITAAQQLGLSVERIQVQTGDTALPPAPVAGGSNTTASLCNAVARACEQIRDRIARAAVADPISPFAQTDPARLRLRDGQLVCAEGAAGGTATVGEPLERAIRRVGDGYIEVYCENTPPGMKPQAVDKLYQGQVMLAGGAALEDRIQFAFGAQFVEVRVHARTAEVRAPRAVGAFACGRIINPTAAKSQLMGGQIWGISAALLEATDVDQRYARYYNKDLAEYLIPVNADITDIETIMLPELDTQVNGLGIKGIGELGNVGMNAAVANAVFHATGVRVRELPVRMEQLLQSKEWRSVDTELSLR